MSDQRDREFVQRAVDTCLSELQGDPWLAQRVINDAKAEPKKAKKLKLGLALVIVLLLGMLAVAIAATRLGWVDYFTGRQGVAVPEAAREALDVTAPRQYPLGPVTFTYHQLLTDRRIALSAAEVHTTDGSEALYASSTDVYDAVDAISDTVLDMHRLTPGVIWLDAAEQLGLPLYGVRALLEIGEPYGDGSAMEDAMWNEDGSIVYLNMPSLLPGAVLDELPATLYMSVTQFDPATGDVVQKWQAREDVVLPVAPLLDEKTYLPEGDATLAGMTLHAVHAERYVTGVYLSCSLTAPDDMSADEAMEALYGLSLCDAEGRELPRGISLSSGARTKELPAVTLETMSSMEALPDALIVRDGATEVTLH